MHSTVSQYDKYPRNCSTNARKIYGTGSTRHITHTVTFDPRRHWTFVSSQMTNFHRFRVLVASADRSTFHCSLSWSSWGGHLKRLRIIQLLLYHKDASRSVEKERRQPRLFLHVLATSDLHTQQYEGVIAAVLL